MRRCPVRVHRAVPSAGGGWTLVETILVLGVVSALTAGIYAALSPASATAQAKAEQDNLKDLSTAIDRSFGLLGGFSSVSTSRVVADDLVPSRMRDGSALRSKWGSSVTVDPFSVNAPNDAFAVTYPGASAEVCAKLASAVARTTYDIRINGTSVYDATGLRPERAAARCSDGNATMQFIYHSGLVTGTSVAATPVVLPPSTPGVSPPVGPPIDIGIGPVAPTGPATPGPPVVPTAPPPGAPPPASPPPVPATPTSPTSPPGSPPVTPPPGLTPCVAPGATPQNQAPNCAAGQYGVLTQQRTGTYSCPEAWDAAVLTWSGWTTTSNTCQPCPADANEAERQWVSRSAACPAGQSGSQTWEAEQGRSRVRGYSCPAGTTTLPPPSYTAWTVWSDTGATRNTANTCAPVVAPPPPGFCPPGQYVTANRYWDINTIGTGVESTCQGSTWITPGRFSFPGPPPNDWECSSSAIISNGGYFSVKNNSCVSDHIVGEIEYSCGYTCTVTPPVEPPAVNGSWVLNANFGGPMSVMSTYCSAIVVPVPPARVCRVGETAPYTQNPHSLWCNAATAQYSYWKCQ